MMSKRWIIFTALVFLNTVLTQAVIGQTDSHSIRLILNAVSLLDVEPSGTVTLAMGQPADAGLPPQAATNNTKWINYTSCLATTTTSRTVSVQLTGTSSFPAGVSFQLQVGTYSGSGSGIFGTSAGAISLTNGMSSTQIITGIRGAYTGDGTGNGHQLTYSLQISNYASLVSGTYGPWVVTYTISN